MHKGLFLGHNKGGSDYVKLSVLDQNRTVVSLFSQWKGPIGAGSGSVDLQETDTGKTAWI